MGQRGRVLRAALLIALSAWEFAMVVPRVASSRPIAEDYSATAFSLQHGFWRAQALIYDTATGRFSHTFVYGLLAHAGSWAGRVLPATLILLWVFAACRAAHFGFAAMTMDALPVEEIAAGTGFVAAVMNASPDVYQSLIWTSGLITYGLPVIAATVIAWLVLRPSPPLLVAIVALIAGGCSEIAGLAQLLFSGVLLTVLPRTRRSLVAVAVGSALALLIVSAAPGNFRRRTHYTPMPAAPAAAATLTGVPVAVAATVVGGSAVLVPLVVFLTLAGNDRRALPPRLAVLTFAATLVIMGLTLFTCLLWTGRIWYGRVQFIPIAYLVATIVVATLALPRPRSNAIAATLTIVAAFAGVGGMIAITPLQLQSIRESREFAATADRVAAAARQNRGAALVVAAPRTFENVEYLSPDPEFWTNRAMAYRLGLQSIRSATPNLRR